MAQRQKEKTGTADGAGESGRVVRVSALRVRAERHLRATHPVRVSLCFVLHCARNVMLI